MKSQDLASSQIYLEKKNTIINFILNYEIGVDGIYGMIQYAELHNFTKERDILINKHLSLLYNQIEDISNKSDLINALYLFSKLKNTDSIFLVKCLFEITKYKNFFSSQQNDFIKNFIVKINSLSNLGQVVNLKHYIEQWGYINPSQIFISGFDLTIDISSKYYDSAYDNISKKLNSIDKNSPLYQLEVRDVLYNALDIPRIEVFRIITPKLKEMFEGLTFKDSMFIHKWVVQFLHLSNFQKITSEDLQRSVDDFATIYLDFVPFHELIINVILPNIKNLKQETIVTYHNYYNCYQGSNDFDLNVNIAFAPYIKQNEISINSEINQEKETQQEDIQNYELEKFEREEVEKAEKDENDAMEIADIESQTFEKYELEILQESKLQAIKEAAKAEQERLERKALDKKRKEKKREQEEKLKKAQE